MRTAAHNALHDSAAPAYVSVRASRPLSSAGLALLRLLLPQGS